MYLVMMTLHSGCFGVIFECSKSYKKICFFSVSILSVKVKIVDERKNKELIYKKKKISLLMFICKIWLNSETINKLVC